MKAIILAWNPSEGFQIERIAERQHRGQCREGLALRYWSDCRTPKRQAQMPVSLSISLANEE